MRKLKALGIVIAIYALAFLVEIAMALNSPNYGGGATIVVILISVAVLAQKVGYRWFDCFFLMIPIYGIFFLFRIAYRVAYLPERDWSERAVS
jgi:Mn2+/Fe2+ NRAMP family transporter